MFNRLLYNCSTWLPVHPCPHLLYSAPLCLRSPLRPQLSVFTAFWAYGCLWPWLSWACSYCGLGIFVGTCERHRQNLQTCLSEALCVHSCLFSPLSVHMVVWNRALNHTKLEPPLTTELFASQWEVWHKGPGEALLGTNYSSPFTSVLWFS